MGTATTPLPHPPALVKPVPGIAQSIALCALFYIVVVAVAIPLELLKIFAGLRLDMFSSLLIQQVIAWPVTIWLGLLWAGTSFREAYPLRLFPLRIVPALLLASFGATILLLEAARLIPVPELLKQTMQKAMSEQGPPSKLTLFFPVVIVAPVAEELFFRGLVLSGYLGRYTVTKAVWMSALLFAVFHLTPWQVLVALPLGLFFAWLVLRTGSLLPGILSHAMVNFSTNFLLGPLVVALGYTAEQLQELGHFPLSVLGIGGAAAVLGGFILWWQLGKSTPPSVPGNPAQMTGPALREAEVNENNPQ